MIEVGRLWRYIDLLEVTSMSSVLLSLGLSMFTVAQALTSLIHDCKCEVAQIFYLGEQTSVIVSHQHMNDV